MSAYRKFFVCGRRRESEMNSEKESIDDITSFLNRGSFDKRTELVMVPPEHCVNETVSKLTNRNVEVGAAHTADHAFDAHSAQKVKDSGGQWVILGHMERRRAGKDIYEGIAGEVGAALAAGLKVMVCVGDTLRERELVHTDQVLCRQLERIAEGVADWSRVVLVYQPMWVMNTGKKTTTGEVVQIFKAMREWMTARLHPPSISIYTRIIFGGPVCGNNCEELSAKEDIDGFLVEGSTISYDFLKVVNARK